MKGKLKAIISIIVLVAIVFSGFLIGKKRKAVELTPDLISDIQIATNKNIANAKDKYCDKKYIVSGVVDEIFSNDKDDTEDGDNWSLKAHTGNTNMYIEVKDVKSSAFLNLEIGSEFSFIGKLKTTYDFKDTLGFYLYFTDAKIKTKTSSESS